MSETTLCPKCGQSLPADALTGLCPKCLVAAGLESEPQGAPTASSGGISKFEPAIAADLAGKFPQLEILELLGRGGMGAVYKARQRGLDRLVAVKVLPPEIGRDAAFAERFAREAKALAKLSHNHIVSVFDFGQADGLFYIVMEYVDGANLRQTIQTGKLTPGEALAIGTHHSSPIRLLLSDVVMPGLTGPSLADRFAQIHPETEFLFIAGLPDSPEVCDRILNCGRAFLAKPFVPRTLLEKVGEVLGADRPAAAFSLP